MPRNEGIPPPFARVDVRYRCGVIARAVEPSKRRWSIDDPAFGAGYDFDIVHWQRCEGGRG